MTREKERLESALGRPLVCGEPLSIASFNDLPEAMIAELRALRSRSAALRYLEFFVVRTAQADSFIDDLASGDVDDVSSWGRRDVLCHLRGDAERWFEASLEEILTPFSAIKGERWIRIAAKANDLHWAGCGAPGVLVRNASYYFEVSEMLDYADTADDTIEAISEDALDVAFSRWFASRIAYRLNFREKPSSVPTNEAVARALASDWSCWGAPARKGLRGLKASGWPSGEPTSWGFQGEDADYRLDKSD